MRTTVRNLARGREVGVVGAIFILVVVASLVQPRFIAWSNLEGILLSVSIVAVVAIGQAVVIIGRQIDLSVGSIVGVSALTAATLLKSGVVGVPLAIAAAVLAGACMGALNGTIVALAKVPAIVVTLGTLSLFRGLAFLIADGRQVGAHEVPAEYLQLSSGKMLGVPLPVIYALIVVAVGAYLMRSTRSGRWVYAMGGDPEAAVLTGIPTRKLIIGTFTVSGLLAGVAGVMWGSFFGSVNAGSGTGLEFASIAAVVVGGVAIFGGSGSVIGAVLGALLLGAIANSIAVLGLPPLWVEAINGAAILAAVAFDATVRKRIRLKTPPALRGAP
jgi:rhamnose transport system permease protein